MSDKPFQRTLNDFSPGQEIEHFPGKTITESDNNLFCLLTMNHHPLHLDAEYAANSDFGKIVVAGTYVLSLAVGLSVPDISGKAIANLGFSKVEHLYPVFIGDTIYARSKIIELIPSASKPDRGVMKVHTEAYNQDSKVVLSYVREVLLPAE